MGKCYNLTDLNFERNSLTFLPKEIGNLTALKKLNVEGNNLIQPPMEIVRMGIPAMVSYLCVLFNSCRCNQSPGLLHAQSVCYSF